MESVDLFSEVGSSDFGFSVSVVSVESESDFAGNPGRDAASSADIGFHVSPGSNED